MENSIDSLFTKLENLNVLEKNYCEQNRKIYKDFLDFDPKLVNQKPTALITSDDRISLKDGRLYWDYKGAHFEAFFKFGSDTTKLVVSFGIARPYISGPFNEQHPHFSRWTWYPFIDGHYLNIEDPMYYRFHDLKIGWFYGNNEEDYAVYAAEIIKRIADELHIENKNIILYASSAGGTTAIRVGSVLKGSKVAAINPQFDLSRHIKSPNFIETTNYDLHKNDKFHRNDLGYLMKASPETRFMIILNAQSRHDVEVHLDYLIKGFYKKHCLRYGLSQLDNVTFWIYDAPGKDTHNMQDDYRIYAYMRYLLDRVDEEDFVEKYHREVLYINEWWHYQSETKNEIRQLKDELQSLKDEKEIHTLAMLKGIRSKNALPALCEKNTARIDIINISPQPGKYTDLDFLSVDDPNANVAIATWIKRNDGNVYLLHSDSGKTSFTLRCIGDGQLEIVLRGIFKTDENGVPVPFWIKYTSLQINGITVFNNTQNVWHNKPYKFHKDVKNGDIIYVSAQWKGSLD